MYDIPVTLTTNPKKKPEDESKLGFGKIFTDHMFIMDYEKGRGWHDARVVPYGPFVPAVLCPRLPCLHLAGVRLVHLLPLLCPA